MKWFIEKCILDDRINEFIEVVKSYDDTVVINKGISIDKSLLDFKQPTFAFCSIPSASQINRSCVPGTYYSDKYFDVNVYGQYFYEWLLNKDFYILPLWRLFQEKEAINRMWPNFFVKPVAGNKRFTGFSVESLDKLEIELDRVIQQTMVLVAPKKEIISEYRFWIVDAKIAGCSSYRIQKELVEKEGCSDSMRYYVEHIINEVKDEYRNYTLDVAIADWGYSVVEINSLSSSGLYAVNFDGLISALRPQVIRDFEEYDNE
jgi:hypothetical protein